MHLFGIRFNLATIWGLPMILGISAEFDLNVMFRYLEGRAYGGPLLARSTVLGVVLNGLIKIVGFGSLLIAAHRGITPGLRLPQPARELRVPPGSNS